MRTTVKCSNATTNADFIEASPMGSIFSSPTTHCLFLYRLLGLE